MPTSKGVRPGAASTIVMVISAASIIGALLYSSTIPGSSSRTAAPMFAAPKTSSRLELSPDRLLKETGINPDTLATIGATAEQTAAVVAAGREHVTAHGAALADALRSERSAKQRLATLESVVQAGQATSEQQSLLASVRQEADTARDAAEALRVLLVAASLAPLTDNQRSAFSNIRAAVVQGVRLPLPFLVTVREESERTLIRDALAESRIMQRRGESLSDASQAILTRARQDSATSSAESDLASNREAVTASWRAAMR